MANGSAGRQSKNGLRLDFAAPTMKLLLCAALLALLSNPARGHGSMVHPRSRNSVDAFANVPAADRHTFGPCANISGGACDNGQSSFWYSQGCFIGCPTCDHVSGRRQTDVRVLVIEPVLR